MPLSLSFRTLITLFLIFYSHALFLYVLSQMYTFYWINLFFIAVLIFQTCFSHLLGPSYLVVPFVTSSAKDYNLFICSSLTKISCIIIQLILVKDEQIFDSFFSLVLHRKNAIRKTTIFSVLSTTLLIRYFYHFTFRLCK